jgi:hypothetical protein
MGFPLTQFHPTPGCPRRRDRRDDLRWAAGASRGHARLGCAPHRLRRGVAVLLWLGTATGAVAVLSGLRSVLNVDARDGVRQARPDRFEAVRRAMVGWKPTRRPPVAGPIWPSRRLVALSRGELPRYSRGRAQIRRSSIRAEAGDRGFGPTTAPTLFGFQLPPARNRIAAGVKSGVGCRPESYGLRCLATALPLQR